MKSIDPYSKTRFEFRSGIGEALFPKGRRKVIALFFSNPEERFYFRQTVRLLGESPGSVQRELKSLTQAGLLTMEPIGNLKFYQANQASPIFEELKSIAEKTFGLVDIVSDLLRTKGSGRIKVAWIFGSVAGGEDSSASDIDLMVIGSLSFRELVSILKPLEVSLRRPANPTLYTEDEFKSKLDQKNRFITNVLESEKLFVVGTKDDLTRLAE